MAVLNESVFKGDAKTTIVGWIKNLFVPTPDKDKKDDNYLGGGISDFTKNLVLTFPVLCDDTISPETAGMISKVNEANAATMLRMLFSAMNIKADNGAAALAKIHKNIKTNMMDIYDAMNMLDSTTSKLKGEVDKVFNEEYIGFKRRSDAIDAINEQAKKPCKAFPVDSLNENSLNDYTLYTINGKTVARYTAIKEADTVQDAVNNPEAKEISLAPKLTSNDIKKNNELEPTVLEVNYYEVKYNDNGNEESTGRVRKFLTGVKSRLIKVESNDMIERLVSKNKNKVSFFNFIRATTGEIGFFKDFLLALDQAKLDSKNAVKKGPAAEMWNVLAARSTKNNKNKFRNAGNDASAITTLVISQETVNTMKKYYKFDLERLSNAKMILDAYNLMGIIICDDSIEVAKSLYSGNDMFEETAYSYLEKRTDSGYKKVVNLIGQMNAR